MGARPGAASSSGSPARTSRSRGARCCSFDDILDEGQTLLAIRARFFELGASEVLLAAFAVKIRKEPPRVMADFTGIRVPDRFVFGFGMDVGGSWRNLPSIRALSETSD